MCTDFFPCDVCIYCGDEKICPLVSNGFQSECDIFASFFGLNLVEVNEI